MAPQVRPEVAHGGRPKSFSEPTERLNVMLPVPIVRAIRQRALDEARTPGQVIAALLAPLIYPTKS